MALPWNLDDMWSQRGSTRLLRLTVLQHLRRRQYHFLGCKSSLYPNLAHTPPPVPPRSRVPFQSSCALGHVVVGLVVPSRVEHGTYFYCANANRFMYVRHTPAYSELCIPPLSLRIVSPDTFRSPTHGEKRS